MNKVLAAVTLVAAAWLLSCGERGENREDVPLMTRGGEPVPTLVDTAALQDFAEKMSKLTVIVLTGTPDYDRTTQTFTLTGLPAVQWITEPEVYTYHLDPDTLPMPVHHFLWTLEEGDVFADDHDGSLTLEDVQNSRKYQLFMLQKALQELERLEQGETIPDSSGEGIHL